MRVKFYLHNGLVGCQREEVMDVEDDVSDEELEELAREWMFEQIEYGVMKIEGDGDE